MSVGVTSAASTVGSSAAIRRSAGGCRSGRRRAPAPRRGRRRRRPRTPWRGCGSRRRGQRRTPLPWRGSGCTACPSRSRRATRCRPSSPCGHRASRQRAPRRRGPRARVRAIALPARLCSPRSWIGAADAKYGDAVCEGTECGEVTSRRDDRSRRTRMPATGATGVGRATRRDPVDPCATVRAAGRRRPDERPAAP